MIVDHLACLTAELAARRPVAMVTVVAVSDRPRLAGRHLVAGPAGILTSELDDPGIEASLEALAKEALATGRARTLSVAGLRAYVEPYLPPPALVLVGAGHVAKAVAQQAKLLGFDLTVIDDRREYANPERFPEADQVICSPFLEGLRSLELGARHHVLLLTRGHRYDMLCLREVIDLPVAYIGMIGSRTRVDTVFRLLTEEHGVDPAHFAKVYAPIGLDVGGRSPGEIAVAIAAELLKVRYGGTGESLSRLGRDKVHGR